MLNVKNYFNTNKETFLSAYLLITEIYTYLSYGDGIALPRTQKKQQQRDGNPCMFYVHYNFHAQDYCMIDDTYGRDTCLALCEHINFKGL